MSVNSHYFAINSLTQLVQNQIKQRVNYPQQLAEIHKLIANFGFDCEQHVYGLIFESLYSIHANNQASSYLPVADQSERVQLLVKLFHDLRPFRKANFISAINFGFLQFTKKILITGPEKLVDTIDSLVNLLSFETHLEELGFRFACTLVPICTGDQINSHFFFSSTEFDPSSQSIQDHISNSNSEWENLSVATRRFTAKVLISAEKSVDSDLVIDSKLVQDIIRSLLVDPIGNPVHSSLFPLVRFVFGTLITNCREELREPLFAVISNSIPHGYSGFLNSFASLVAPKVPQARRDLTERNNLLDSIMDCLNSNSENGRSESLSLSEEQVAHLILAESNGTLSKSDPLLQQFPITPKLCAHLLCLLCEAPSKSSSVNESNPQTNTPPTSPSAAHTRSDEIDQLAEICREFMISPSGKGSSSPLMDVLAALDHEDFVKHAQSIFKTNVILYPLPKSSNTSVSNGSNSSGISSTARPEACFLKFWQFCVIMCHTEKQGPYIVTSLFFRSLWRVNLEFQFGFVAAMVRSRVLAKLLQTSSQTAPNSAFSDIVPLDQPVLHIEQLKMQPDFEQTPELTNWKFQRVYQILLDFTNVTRVPVTSNGTNGGPRFKINTPIDPPVDAPFYTFVIDLLKVPATSVPDLLVLGVLGSQPVTVSSSAKMDMLTLAMPAFLSSHPNSAAILNIVWNSSEMQTSSVQATSNSANAVSSSGNGVGWSRKALLQAMCDFYDQVSSTEQQQRLSRILDVAQDLKALSHLLNGNCYPFVMDLACLASRREYLKLDKWFIDKIREHGESFVSEAVKFLSFRCPFLIKGTTCAELSPNVVPLAAETVAVALACLQKTCPAPGPASQQNGPHPNLPYLENLSQKLQEEIFTMLSNSSIVLDVLQKQANRQAQSGSVAQSVGIPIKPQQQPHMPTTGDFGMGALSLNANSGAGTPPASTGSASGNILPFSIQRQTFAPPAVPPPVALRPLHNSQATPTGVIGNISQTGHSQSNMANQPEKFRQAINDLAAIFPEATVNISRDIENEADAYFKRIFNKNTHNHLTVDEVLEMLRSFKDSEDEREREVFTCMIRNLFKEYAFFPQYPAQELLTTAKLFGGIIQLGLVKYMALVGALRYVLEALRKPPESKMYYFGITALDRFKAKLKDYPLYCHHLASLPNFEKFPPQLRSYIEYGAETKEFNPESAIRSESGIHPAPPQTASVPSAPSVPSARQPPPSISVPNVAFEFMVDTPVPPEVLQDRIAFIINNLSLANLPQKADDFKNVIGKDETYFNWLAQYFVMKRASIEPNFHSLYANFIDTVKLSLLTELIIKETYRNIKALLQSNKEIANFSDRSLLKNLGHWLGVITIARNRTVLHDSINLKLLLVEAYHKGTQDLLYVVPLIAKILESCAKSKLFCPPCPWTMNIIKALVELHQEPSLKLNLKFEVEVLCKTLNIDLKDYVGKSTILKDQAFYERVILREPQLGGPGPKKPPPASAGASIPPQPVPTRKPQVPLPAVQETVDRMPTPPQRLIAPLEMLMQRQSVAEQLFNNIPQPSLPPMPTTGLAQPGLTPAGVSQVSARPYDVSNIIVIGSLNQLVETLLKFMRPEQINVLKASLKTAIERAVQEWIQPVVERSVKVALTTTEQIVKKDFALDPDENHMHLAAQAMIRNLAGGMALITCRDPLQMSMITNVRTVLHRAIPQQLVGPVNIDLCATQIAQDNIEAACAFIQKTAIEKSLPEMEKRLGTELEIRQKARQEGRRYCDPLLAQYHVERMPEQIRLKPGVPVTAEQFSVYEELGRNIPGLSNLDQVSNQVHSQIQQNQAQKLINHLQEQQMAQVPNAQIEHLRQQQLIQLAEQQARQAEQALRYRENLVPQATVPAEPTNAQANQDTAVMSAFEKLMTELDKIAHQFSNAGTQMPQLVPAVHQIVEALARARHNALRDMHVMINILQKTVDALGDLVQFAENGYGDVAMLSNARDVYLIIMKTLGDQRVMGFSWVSKHVTRVAVDRIHPPNSSIINIPDEVFDILYRAGLINTSYLDTQLANLIETASSQAALEFPFRFLRVYGNQFQEVDFHDTCNALARLHASSTNDGQTALSLQIQEILNNFSRSPRPEPVPQEITTLTPQNMMDKVERLLRDWISLYHSTQNPSKVFAAFVQQLNFQGFLKTDEIISRFFRLCTEMCVELCYRILNSQVASSQNSYIIQTEIRNKCFHTLDAFTALIVLLIKHSGLSAANTGSGGPQGAETAAKLNLLTKVLQIIVTFCLQDQEIRGAEFQHLPYYRILIVLLMDLVLNPNNMGVSAISGVSNVQELQISPELIQNKVLEAFVTTLHSLRPAKCPSFAYAWLDFVSHRTFMEKALDNPKDDGHVPFGWQLYASLLLDLIRFLAPFLKNVEMLHPIELLYRGTMKLLLILLHDFPEFLCEFIYAILNVLPSNVIQMRNLLLSAFPRSMRLPDPFAPSFKIDSLAEIAQLPRGFSAISKMAQSIPFKLELDSYLKSRGPVTLLTDLRGHLQVSGRQLQAGPDGQPPFTDSANYNVPLINALVLYVGSVAIQTISPKNISLSTISHTPHMDIFQNLAVALDTEGRYLFLNAVVNQLRYPNSVTHYFSAVLLYLFAESNNESIQEEITRVLLERMIVQRPHPWGLLVTFIELVKNPAYKFWSHDFVHCAPEIDKYWQSLGLTFQASGQPVGHGVGGSLSVGLQEQELKAISDNMVLN